MVNSHGLGKVVTYIMHLGIGDKGKGDGPIRLGISIIIKHNLQKHCLINATFCLQV